jgi:hypothetical protein
MVDPLGSTAFKFASSRNMYASRGCISLQFSFSYRLLYCTATVYYFGQFTSHAERCEEGRIKGSSSIDAQIDLIGVFGSCGPTLFPFTLQLLSPPQTSLRRDLRTRDLSNCWITTQSRSETRHETRNVNTKSSRVSKGLVEADQDS